MKDLFGGVEGGGTKFICAIGPDAHNILAEDRFPTTTPQETLDQVIGFFRKHDNLAAIGIACFGPLDLRLDSPTYGRLLSTPKAGWSGADLLGRLRQAFQIPIGLDNDVNGAALGEHLWGAGQGLDTFIYLTIGTGIGGGVFAQGNLLHGLLHPEMGHIPLPHDRARDPFEGTCPFHGDCFEGLACGPAMEKRWGQRAESLPEDHPAWDLEASYIAHALASYIYSISPQRIIVGGGVGSVPHMLKKVREYTRSLINGYIPSRSIQDEIDRFIVPPGLGNRAGVAGALALARQAFQKDL
ncbi:MAG: ROK family protein [Chloroflexi bacterium]|nr:ROK family protein [Chloroflexota bacterium]